MRPRPTPLVHGFVHPAFERVGRAFAANFETGSEVGAALAIYHRGVPVVDVWAGLADGDANRPWTNETLQFVFSTTKGMLALSFAMLVDRGLVRYDDRVAEHWPEFAGGGKGNITIRQLMAHTAGLCAVPGPEISMHDFSRNGARLMEGMVPLWEPGTKHGYHPWTLGTMIGELLTRIDPKHRTVGEFFADEVAGPLGAEFHMGLPARLAHRVSRMTLTDPVTQLFSVHKVPFAVPLYLEPSSLTCAAAAAAAAAASGAAAGAATDGRRPPQVRHDAEPDEPLHALQQPGPLRAKPARCERARDRPRPGTRVRRGA